MIIDDIGLAVSDYEKSKAFFCKALAPLGIDLIVEVQGWAGFGRAGCERRLRTARFRRCDAFSSQA